LVEAAIVRLQAPGSNALRTTLTDQTGSLHFSAVEPGAYTLTITAGGFMDEKTNVSVVSGENPPLPPVVLQIAPAIGKVDVTLPPHELAAQQVHAEEKQRLLGIVPNFYVTYDPNAAPVRSLTLPLIAIFSASCTSHEVSFVRKTNTNCAAPLTGAVSSRMHTSKARRVAGSFIGCQGPHGLGGSRTCNSGPPFPKPID
jgi:hypothetical protein